MQTLRFNPFNQIHKGLRALLYDTALLLQHTDFTRAEEKERITDRMHFLIEAFAFHAHTEDHRIFPMITGFAPELVDDFESQHQTDEQLSLGLQECVNTLAEANSPSQNVWAGNELLQAFNSFLAFNVEHMKKEETMINAVLWQHYNDEQLLFRVREIGGSIPIEENMLISAWMLKGLAVHEIIPWYKGIEKAAPPVVFEKFRQLAERTLAPSRWSKIREALQDTEQVL
ncbi:MAG TPA: hemerythrin domain-containing protein [Puia sp.]|jgi:hemerythrin-like domain-containing protein|nr:hemerythrin domain-containing protein [Puia sp.]